MGTWRVILEFDAQAIRVLRVLHRREAYRKSARIHQDLPEPECTHLDETSNDRLVPYDHGQEPHQPRTPGTFRDRLIQPEDLVGLPGRSGGSALQVRISVLASLPRELEGL